MSSRREFHTAGPETRKLLDQKRRVLVRGVVRCPRAAERRWALVPISEMGMQDRLRYVGPRPSVERVSNEGCNFENDALADGKPMKLIPEHGRDVVEFPCVRDQPGRRVENGLQPSQDSVRGSVENAVAIIHATWYEGMDQCLCGFHCERSPDGSQLSQLEEAASRYVVDMQVHPQFWIESHSQILCGGWEFDGMFSNLHALRLDLRQLLFGPEPHELGFVWVQFQPVRSHPPLDLFDAFRQSRMQQSIDWWRGSVGRVVCRRHTSGLQHRVK